MIATDGVMVVMRFFHIVAGALWVGAGVPFSLFLGAAGAKVGPSRGPANGRRV